MLQCRAQPSQVKVLHNTGLSAIGRDSLPMGLERSLWLEHDSAIAFGNEVSRNIHEKNNFEGQQLIIIGDPGDTWLRSHGFMRPRWSQDTEDDEEWTDVDGISCYLAATSVPRKVPLIHTQEDFNRFVLKVAPNSSLQGRQTSYIEGLISMEPQAEIDRMMHKAE